MKSTKKNVLKDEEDPSDPPWKIAHGLANCFDCGIKINPGDAYEQRRIIRTYVYTCMDCMSLRSYYNSPDMDDRLLTKRALAMLDKDPA